MGNPFFYFLKYQTKCSKKIVNSNYIALYQKTAFETDFGPREIPKLENLPFHFHAFSGWGTSQSPNSVLEAVFLIKCYIITIVKKMAVFWSVFKKQKKRFAIVFSKTDFPRPPFKNQSRVLKVLGSSNFYANHYWFILWNDWIFLKLSPPSIYSC